MKPHRHAELIKAWADGAQIEYLCGGQWYEVFTPSWEYDGYRVKPKPDEVRYMSIENLDPKYQPANIKLTFDGETGKLKAAEVV